MHHTSHVKALLGISWRRHQMETFFALLVRCAGNSPVTGEFPSQRPVTRSFDVFSDLRPNKRFSKQSWGWWFETPLRSLWRHCNVLGIWLKWSNQQSNTLLLGLPKVSALSPWHIYLQEIITNWAPSQYPKRRLFVRSRKVSKPRDWYFKLSYRFEIWQAHRQHCCRSACQISERSGNSKYKSRGFETLRDLTERRLFGYWDRALVDYILYITLHTE